MIKDVSDLEVYKLSLNLLPELYSLVRRLPKSEYDLRFQSERAGKSIPALVAEGFGKRSSEKEFKRFLKMAIGSSDEVVTHLRVVAIVVPRLILEARQLENKYKELSKRINALCTVWKSGGAF